ALAERDVELGGLPRLDAHTLGPDLAAALLEHQRERAGVEGLVGKRRGADLAAADIHVGRWPGDDAQRALARPAARRLASPHLVELEPQGLEPGLELDHLLDGLVAGQLDAQRVDAR